jgi:hypothetical protein
VPRGAGSVGVVSAAIEEAAMSEREEGSDKPNFITFDLSTLAYLPCGCAADLMAMNLEGDAVSCPWCDAVFMVSDVALWLRDVRRPVVKMVPVLVRDGERALEIVGTCFCGHAMVKERVHGAKTEHFGKTLEFLRN